VKYFTIKEYQRGKRINCDIKIQKKNSPYRKILLGNLDRQKISRTVLQIQFGSEVDLGGGKGLMSQVELDLVDLGTILKSQLGISAAFMESSP